MGLGKTTLQSVFTQGAKCIKHTRPPFAARSLATTNTSELQICPNFLKGKVGDVVELGKTNKILMKRKKLDMVFYDRKELQQLGIKEPDFVYEYSHGSRAFVPDSEALEFDYLRGYSAKNGKFEIYSYRGSSGKLLGRETIYPDKGIRIVKQFKEDEYMGRRLTDKRTYSLDGTLLESDCRQFAKVEDSWLSTEEIMHPDNPENTHIIEKLEAGKKKQQIKYKFNWNSDTCANIPVSENQPERFREFLPLFVPVTKANRAGMVNYIGKMEEKNLGISGLVSKPIILENLRYKHTGNSGNCCCSSGRITIDQNHCLDSYIKFNGNRDVLDSVSHEMKHRYDFFELFRTEENAKAFRTFMTNGEINEIEANNPGTIEFATNSIKRGIISKDNPKTPFLEKIGEELENYEELCRTIGHDYLECEKSANTYAKSEVDLLSKFFDGLFKYLNFK